MANAGITRDTLLMRMSDDDWDAVHRHQPDRCVPGGPAGGPADDPRPGSAGSIFISSVVGQLGSAGQVNYAASKSGLVGLARSLARELGSRGVTANVVAPGLHRDRHDRRAGRGPGQGKYAEQIPLGRMGTVDDIAADDRVPGRRRGRLHHRRP